MSARARVLHAKFTNKINFHFQNYITISLVQEHRASGKLLEENTRLIAHFITFISIHSIKSSCTIQRLKKAKRYLLKKLATLTWWRCNWVSLCLTWDFEPICTIPNSQGLPDYSFSTSCDPVNAYNVKLTLPSQNIFCKQELSIKPPSCALCYSMWLPSHFQFLYEYNLELKVCN